MGSGRRVGRAGAPGLPGEGVIPGLLPSRGPLFLLFLHFQANSLAAPSSGSPLFASGGAWASLGVELGFQGLGASVDSAPWSVGSALAVHRLSCSEAREVFWDQG